MSEAKAFWTRFSELAVGALYPTKCGICGAIADGAICRNCAGDFREIWNQPQDVDDLDFAFCAYAYQGQAAKAIQRLKYSKRTCLGAPLAERLTAVASQLDLIEDRFFVPIPIHWTRFASRGFNQSDLLCDALPRAQVKRDWLRRTRRTKAQAGLSLADRQRNLEGAFVAPHDLSGKSIVLIDDVITSGQTASECARALRAAGAWEVGILAVTGNPMWDGV